MQLARWRWLSLLVSMVIIAVCTASLAQDSPQKTSPTSQAQAQAKPAQNRAASTDANPADPGDSSIRLGVGDLLEMSVYGVPELSTKTRVGSNGDIYLPLIDYVHVAGLTIDEAQAVVEKRYGDGGFLKDPHVSLFIDEYASQGASVLGEVGKPGVYPVLGQQRLLDLISAAGGLSDKAGRTITITHRNQPDQPVTVALARNLTDGGDDNVQVFPGDTIVVHRADVIYVVGEVGKPSGFLMDNGGLTVLQVIALAGGTTRTAKLNGVRLIRKGPNGITESPVQLKRILEAKAPDVPLQADDILFVPTSTGKVAAGHTIQAAIQAATALSIVAVRP